MEHTDIYLVGKQFIDQESRGLQHGKTDSIDAQRIAGYAYRFRDQLRL
jgi:hypothetical protein